MTKAAFALAAILAVTASYAEDFTSEKLDNWHHWRGPLANGTAPHGDPPVVWDAQKNIKWKAPLPGQGGSTPIVWGDNIFVTTAIETDRVAKPEELPKVQRKDQSKTKPSDRFHKFEVLCFDRQTGKLRWQKTANEAVPHEGHHPTHSYCAGSPTTDGKFLYVSFGSFGNYCYDFDGNLIWKNDFGRMQTRLAWGEAVTPVIHGNNLILNWDNDDSGGVFCLDAHTGKTRWKADSDESSTWNTPLVVEHNGRTQVIVNGTKHARSYDLATGKELWRTGAMTINAIPSPVSADGVAYVMAGYQGSVVLAIPLDAAGDLAGGDKFLWKHTRGTPYVSSPVLAGDRLYFLQVNSPLLTSLDIKTGKPVLDRVRLPGLKNEIYASPLGVAGRLYITDREGTTLVLKQSDKLEILATNKLGDPIDASPVVIGKQLYLRGAKYLYCIGD